jgi:uncharacterized OB-fold protein
LDKDQAFFWTAGAQGRLQILRCRHCGRFQHPPLPRCVACGSLEMRPEPVSGQARLKSFTVNHQPWVPGLDLPYVFAVVELIEQPELYVFTNIVGCNAEDVRTGMAVEVTFEKQEDVWLPLFRPRGAPHAA